MREFSSSQEMRDHYATLRSKFFPPPPPPRYAVHESVAERTILFVGHEFKIKVQFKKNARDKIQPLAILLLYEYNKMSLPRIGKLLGRNHTSILYTVRLARHLLVTDAGFAVHYKRIINRLDQP